MWSYNYTNGDELYHYGRKGMKWGQHIFGRLYKNKDGTLTALGRKRAQKYAKKYKQLTGSRPTDSNIKKNTKTTSKKSSSSAKPEQKQIISCTNTNTNTIKNKNFLDKIKNYFKEKTEKFEYDPVGSWDNLPIELKQAGELANKMEKEIG